jgi:hypothetical protein
MAAEVEDSNISPEVVDRAKQMGWKPIEEFRGNPDNFVTAEKFVAMAETSLPHLKGTLKVMERKMADQDTLLRKQTEEIGGLRGDLQEFVAFSKSAEQRAYDKAVRDLKMQQVKAKDDGDLPAFAEATERLDDLIKEYPAAAGKEPTKTATSAATVPAPDKEWHDWMNAEPGAWNEWQSTQTWYNEEPEMFAYAQQMDKFLLTKNGFKKPRSEHLKELTKLVKKKFPAYFGNAARAKGSPVEGDTGGSPSGGDKHSYNDLPPDAKAQCDKWSGKNGKGTGTLGENFTREDYLKSYKW